MAFEDWTFDGLKTRLFFRLQQQPMFTEAMRGIAINKGIAELYLFARVHTTIWEAFTFLLTAGDFAGSFAMEYPLPPNTLWVKGVNMDGIPLEGPISEEEMASTGMDRGRPSSFGDPREYCIRTEEDGSKTLVLWPRPTRRQRLNVFGGTKPDPLVNPGDVPVISEIYGDSIELYAGDYLTNGQEGYETKNEKFKKDYLVARAEAKIGLRLDRTFKTRRTRTW